MIRYVDTSVLVKVLVTEEHSDAAAADLERSADRGDVLVSSWLAYTELHCALDRRLLRFPEAVNDVVDSLRLVDVERQDFQRAASSSWGLRSADALHLATALRIESDELVTYDRELREAAVRSGLTVTQPGA